VPLRGRFRDPFFDGLLPLELRGSNVRVWFEHLASGGVRADGCAY
jgi:hypothetical protein